MMLIIYKYAFYLLIPFIKLNLIHRIKKGKEEKNRVKERFGISKIKRPKGNLIWIHSSSVGEFNSSTTLIKHLLKNNKILLTTSTVTAREYCKQIFKDNIIHQYAPLDHKPWVEKFINHWSPNLVIWIESDLWPNTIKVIYENKIKQILLNLRISPQSFKKWKIIKNNFAKILSYYDQVYAQSKKDLSLIKKLTDRKIKFIGNLKLTALEKKVGNSKLQKLKKILSSRKVILIASSHKKEEALILKNIKQVINDTKRIILIIVPRHPIRAIEVQMIAKNFFPKSTMKLDSNSLKNTNCLIIKSLGEMQIYYDLCNMVILGGSFIDMGGHNPIEPARSKCVILTGPSIYNWQNIFEDMNYNKACIICKSSNEIAKKMEYLLKNTDVQKKMMNNALKYSKKNKEIIKDILQNLKPYLIKNA